MEPVVIKPTLLERKWYVLYTRPKFEKKITQEILYQDTECYLPVRNELRKWSDRMKSIQSPLFANYVFVKMHLSEKTRILSIPGVIRMVSFEGRPVSISQEEIDKIKRIEAKGSDLTTEYFYCIGDKVRVVQGIFSGLEGILLRKSNQVRFVIKLPVINQAVSVEIESCQVERIG